MTKMVRLQYVFDPLCGWCYASAPALAGIAAAYPDLLELMPSGLFSIDGGRDMTPAWAHHAWTNDQRIAAMTGQVFSEAYHRQVLLGGGVRFDSTMLNRVLTAVRDVDATLEPRLLHDLQVARYVEGRDTSRADEVAAIGAAFAARSGLAWEVPALAERLRADAELRRRTDARIQEAPALMRRLGLRGVPQLLARMGEDVTVFGGASLYHGPSHLLAEIRNRVGAALPGAPFAANRPIAT